MSLSEDLDRAQLQNTRPNPSVDPLLESDEFSMRQSGGVLNERADVLRGNESSPITKQSPPTHGAVSKSVQYNPQNNSLNFGPPARVAEPVFWLSFSLRGNNFKRLSLKKRPLADSFILTSNCEPNLARLVTDSAPDVLVHLSSNLKDTPVTTLRLSELLGAQEEQQGEDDPMDFLNDTNIDESSATSSVVRVVTPAQATMVNNTVQADLSVLQLEVHRSSLRL
eukprot:c8606_g1_i1.p1 GENE.c8606_g1_i1~~c8606_g1_i1.p1  ORF type:complete len:224 (+),score=52.54 c8606_g1_i1:58-729(+)